MRAKIEMQFLCGIRELRKKRYSKAMLVLCAFYALENCEHMVLTFRPENMPSCALQIEREDKWLRITGGAKDISVEYRKLYAMHPGESLCEALEEALQA